MSAKDVIIALDFPTREEALGFLDQFPAGEKPFVKIGMELFYAEGPQMVREIKSRGHRIFLDLKLHDIPNTVGRAMAVLSRLDVDMVNLHASGASAMMRAALEGLTRPDGTRPILIAVTQLTSTDAATLKNELLIQRRLQIDFQVVGFFPKTPHMSGCGQHQRAADTKVGKQQFAKVRIDFFLVFKNSHSHVPQAQALQPCAGGAIVQCALQRHQGALQRRHCVPGPLRHAVAISSRAGGWIGDSTGSQNHRLGSIAPPLPRNTSDLMIFDFQIYCPISHQ